MKVREMMQALLDGKKVRSTEWVEGYYFYLDGDELKDSDGEDKLAIFIDDLDYEEYLPAPKFSVGEFVFVKARAYARVAAVTNAKYVVHFYKGHEGLLVNEERLEKV